MSVFNLTYASYARDALLFFFCYLLAHKYSSLVISFKIWYARMVVMQRKDISERMKCYKYEKCYP